jgi:hypothetical protein
MKGQGLAKLLAESNLQALGINQLQEDEHFLEINELDFATSTAAIEDMFSSSGWYCDIVSYLLTL